MKSFLNAQKLKEQIIVHSLDFLENKKKTDRDEALEKLKPFAKFYNIPLKRNLVKQDLKTSLRKFILNNEGYIETITNFYTSLS